jgi:streptogramin lyase
MTMNRTRNRSVLFALLLIGVIQISANSIRAQLVTAHADLANSTSSPSSSLISEFTFPTLRSGPSIINVDQNGGVWVALARAGKIGHLSSGEMREYSLPANSFPVGLVVDRSGQVWYSDIRRNKIGKLDRATGELKDFDIPTKDSWPFSLAFDSHGKLWFTERVGNKIGSLDPTTGEVREFDVPSPNCQPAGLAITPEGQLFFTENSGHKIGQLNPKTGKLIEHTVPTAMKQSLFYGLAGITSDQRGNIWFAILDGRLGFIKRNEAGAYEPVREIPLPTSTTRPAGVAVDRWAIVWFTELDGNSISSYNPTLDQFRRYQIPTGAPDAQPKGPPEVTARGELPVPGNVAKTSRPFGIAVDAQGTVWFSEQYAHKVGKLSPPRVEIFQPQGLIGGTSAGVKVQSRPIDNASLQYFIDDRQIAVGERFDTTSLTPGRHRFHAVLARNGQTVSSAASTFYLQPGVANVRQLLSAMRNRSELNASTALNLRRLLESAERSISAGETTEARRQLREMIVTLESQSLAPNGKSQLLLETLRYMDRFGRNQYYVEVSDRAPCFSPLKITIEVGDTVTWVTKTTGSSSVLAARNGEFTSPSLSGAQTFSHTFTREGNYEYLNTAADNVTATVTVKTRTLQIREFPMLATDRVPGVLAIDRENNVWFTEGGGGFSRLAAIPLNNRIGRLSPDGKITEFETPTMESGPTSIHIGKEGDVWFTERGGNKIGRLHPATGAITEYDIPTPMSVATGITVDAEGLIWYASKMASKIGRLDPKTGAIKEFDTPTAKSQPSTITSDAQGNIWFDERANDRIVRFDPRSGQMREYEVPTQGSRVVGLVPDHQGHVWFLELGANKVGRLDAETGMVLEYSIPTKYSSPFKLTLDQYGRVWFTQAFGNKVGVLANGKFVELAIPTAESMPGGITTDSRGNIWFSEQAGNKIAMIPSGATFSLEIFTDAFSSQ